MPRHDRDEIARRAGYATWREAVQATAGLPQQEAGRLLGVSHPTIRVWRAELGLDRAAARPSPAQSAEAFRQDGHDARHGTANGYRNLGCRCERCTAAWTAYQRDRRG
ncbi:hypothetical protein AB2L27_14625 [Kineococcus sp. LSe6-4]|uniref:Helix-turn-helix domain-containing protein n=1 Tax=Kineococcus halophytocola TaxID=3234027 RepID=A0ABV4H334_9ACTN